MFLYNCRTRPPATNSRPPIFCGFPRLLHRIASQRTGEHSPERSERLQTRSPPPLHRPLYVSGILCIGPHLGRPPSNVCIMRQIGPAPAPAAKRGKQRIRDQSATYRITSPRTVLYETRPGTSSAESTDVPSSAAGPCSPPDVRPASQHSGNPDNLLKTSILF